MVSVLYRGRSLARCGHRLPAVHGARPAPVECSRTFTTGCLPTRAGDAPTARVLLFPRCSA